MTHYTSLQLLAPRRPDQLRDCPFACPLSTQHKFFAGPAFVANYKLRGAKRRDSSGTPSASFRSSMSGGKTVLGLLNVGKSRASTGKCPLSAQSLALGIIPSPFPANLFVDYRKERVHQGPSRPDRSRDPASSYSATGS